MSKPLPSAQAISTSETMFTIGYEGLSQAEYIQALLDQQVRLVVDVRKNPISRKKGFSKNVLSDGLAQMGIAYIHLPGFGIETGLRTALKTDEDYAALFQVYRKKILPGASESIARLSEALKEYGSVALTCFEHDPIHCHRHCVADLFYRKGLITVKPIHL